MAAKRQTFASRLAVRFAFILALAMLPAGLVAIVQTNALEAEIKSRSEVALMGATLQAASAETGMIRRVRGMVGSLAAALPYLMDNPQACTDLMQRAAKVEPSASVVAFVPITGFMACSSVDRTFDFSADPIFQKVVRAREPEFFVNPKGPVSRTSVLGITHPVFDAQGAYLGYAVISLPHAAMEALRFASLVNRGQIEAPVVFWTFDDKGTVLTANVTLDEAGRQVPEGTSLQDYVGTEGEVFQARSVNGQRLTYAVVPIVPGQLLLMSSFLPNEPMFTKTFGWSAYMPILMMWVALLLVSGFAAELLVTRHVRTLNRSINRFALGDRRLLELDFKRAPTELDELATAYLTMTESIVHGEAELEDSLHQKEVLLREVHHRVKNNLQLISSIMNIQIRSAKGGEARDLLKNLQERIMSLATVHRGLYQTSGLADVRARELVPDIVRQIVSMSSGPEKPFQTENDIDDLRLVPDQAVPLSLLLAEALTNAIKYAGATREHPGKVTVRLKRAGGSDALFEIINSKRARDGSALGSGAKETGIGSQLISAFVQQLHGSVETSETEDAYTLRVSFTVSPLALAENRRTTPSDTEPVWTAS